MIYSVQIKIFLKSKISKNKINTFVHFEEKNTSTTKQINNEKYFGQKPNKNPFPQCC